MLRKDDRFTHFSNLAACGSNPFQQKGPGKINKPVAFHPFAGRKIIMPMPLPVIPVIVIEKRV